MPTKISLNRQGKLDSNLDLNSFKIINLANPEEDNDAVNLTFLLKEIKKLQKQIDELKRKSNIK